MVGRSLQSLLYEVQPVDPRTIMAVTVVSIVTALVAATLPAWRAARVDPMIALRHD
jgi:ABC-type lipoprotein release transport system permease subunit